MFLLLGIFGLLIDIMLKVNYDRNLCGSFLLHLIHLYVFFIYFNAKELAKFPIKNKILQFD